MAKKERNLNILMDEEIEEEIIPDLDPTFVEYFFDVLVDNEIDPQVLCEAQKRNKSKNTFNDKLINCEEEEKKIRDIYKTDLNEFEEDDCE